MRSVSTVGLEADAAEQEVASTRPCVNSRAPSAEVVEHVALRELDRPQAGDRERPPVLLLGDDRVVLEVDLGVEAAGQHPLVVAHELVVDAHILQLQAGQLAR